MPSYPCIENPCCTQSLVIGGVRLDVRCGNETFAAKLCKRYRSYVTQPNTPAEIVIETRLLGPTARTQVEQMYRLECPEGNLAQWELQVVADEFIFDRALRVVLSRALPMHGALLVHAAAVTDGVHTYLFPGRSGAGKTTLGRLCQAHERLIISDELVIVSALNQRVVVYGTPFWGELQGRNVCDRHTLSALVIPLKGDRTFCEPTDSKSGLRALLQSVVKFDTDGMSHDTCLDLAMKVVIRVPTHRLFFEKEKDFWEQVTNA